MSKKTPRAKLLAALNQHALASAAFDACHGLHGYPVTDAYYPALLKAKRQLDHLGALNAQGDIEVRLTKKQHAALERAYAAEYGRWHAYLTRISIRRTAKYDRCQAQQPEAV